MSINSLISENLAVVATIDPASRAAGSVLSDEIDMKNVIRLTAILKLGAVSGATIAFSLQSAAASGGSFSNISGKLITIGGSPLPTNQQFILNLRGEEVTNQNQFVKASVIITGSPSVTLYDLTVLAETSIKPASDYDLSSVATITA